jgi:hypothetical protein
MKSIVFTVILIVFSLLGHHCAHWRKPLKLERRDYTGAALKTDGFYYSKKFWNFFLFRNGIFLGGSYSKDFESISVFWNKYGHDSKFLNNDHTQWGRFIIDDKNIAIEKWRGGDAGGRDPSILFNGHIINDTTLLLTGRPFGTDTFRFHAMPTKPDSTNRFIK